MADRDGDQSITLGVLNAVQDNQSVTQRLVAQDLGIALGLANAYLKRCVKKGYVKIAQVPPNRYAYYLTPKGFAEKSRLTTEFLTQSFHFFRIARSECAEIFEQCVERGWTRLALYGLSDFAEVATLCAIEYSVTLVGVVDGRSGGRSFANIPVVASFDELEWIDAVVITDLTNPQGVFDGLIREMPIERVFAPRLLNVVRDPSVAPQQE